MDADPSISVDVETDGWNAVLDDADTIVRQAARYTLEHMSRDGCVSIKLSDDAGIADLNLAYRGRKGATNVLSFPAADIISPPGEKSPLGDLILALQTVVREAREQNKSVTDHTTHLVVHGVLHLLGLDHVEPGDAENMETVEKSILRSLNINDPYLITSSGD